MKLLICGYGNIGRHIFKEFEALKNQITIYDKYNQNYCTPSILDKAYDYAFICVPTERNTDGSCDVSEVEWIVPKINATTIIIKSAVPVGTCEKFYQKNVVISPEYYGTTQHSLEMPNFIILGSREKKYACNVVQLYQQVKNGTFKYIFTDWRTAELAKYMENCWIAAKVTFCSEFAEIAAAYGINYEELRECFVADERVSPYHTYVYQEKPYYDSHCLNKDIPALIAMCEKQNISVPLMKKIHTLNECQKQGRYPACNFKNSRG